MQQFSARRVFNDLGVAKRYCSTDLISDTFVQCGIGFLAKPPPFLGRSLGLLTQLGGQFVRP